MSKNKHLPKFDRYPRNNSLGDKANRRRFIKLYQRYGGVHYKSLPLDTMIERFVVLSYNHYDIWREKQNVF